MAVDGFGWHIWGGEIVYKWDLRFFLKVYKWEKEQTKGFKSFKVELFLMYDLFNLTLQLIAIIKNFNYNRMESFNSPQ